MSEQRDGAFTKTPAEGLRPAAQQPGSRRGERGINRQTLSRAPLCAPLIWVESQLFLKEEKRVSVQTSALTAKRPEECRGN